MEQPYKVKIASNNLLIVVATPFELKCSSKHVKLNIDIINMSESKSKKLAVKAAIDTIPSLMNLVYLSMLEFLIRKYDLS
jgi:hypothetical protein